MFKGKRVILSGNKGNLGPIWEQILKENGAEVFGFDYDSQKPISLKNCDARSLLALKIFYDKYYSLPVYGPPDIIINNAAIDTPPSRKGTSFFTDCENIIKTNLGGAVNLTNMFIRDMIKAREGLIINIGSIQGNIAADWRNYSEGFEKPVGYNISKAGLIQFTRSLAVQYGRYGIRSICLAFGAIDTGKFEEPFKSKFMNNLPLKRFISKDSLEAALKFAITCPELTGQQILIDSGYTSW